MPSHYLYVEDDPLSREAMQIVLRDVMDAQVTLFADSTAFMQRLKAVQPQPDYIFLDINVSPVDGYQLLEMIRADPVTKDYKVLAVTASDIAHIIADLKTHGFDGAISKPIDLRTFPDLIQCLEAGESIW